MARTPSAQATDRLHSADSSAHGSVVRVLGAGSSRRPSDETADATSLGRRPDGVQLRARRSPRLVALGILLACLGGLGGALLWQNMSHTQSVLVMANSVSRGQVVTAGDVTTTTLGAAPGVATLPAGELSSVVGRSAVVDLPKGSLPGPGSVGDALVPTNYVQLGMKLDFGRAPVTPLAPGTKVTLVPVSGAATDAAPAGEPVAAVVVSTAQQTATGDALVFDVAVDPAQAVRVTQLAARGQLSVVREGQK